MKDLLTVYLAGEASPDTRVLIEDYLKTDAALADEVARARHADLSLPATPPQPREKQVLDATRHLIKLRAYTMAAAGFVSLLPLTTVFRDDRVTFLLLRDAPVVGLALWATAVVLWIWHLRIRRRLQVSGL